jgi:CBS domain-containing protein
LKFHQEVTMKAKDLMIPLSECAQVAEDRSLQEAMIMLSAFRQRYSGSDFPPRFVLVRDDRYRIVGVLRHLEILRALGQTAVPGGPSFAKMIAAAPRIAARDAMTHYSEAEHIQADAPLEEAIERMLQGAFRHMLVVEAGTTIGVLRLSEIFARVRKELGHAAQD